MIHHTQTDRCPGLEGVPGIGGWGDVGSFSADACQVNALTKTSESLSKSMSMTSAL